MGACALLQMMESGTKAFVSYVRGYKEHHCRFIFRIQVSCSAARRQTALHSCWFVRIKANPATCDRAVSLSPM